MREPSAAPFVETFSYRRFQAFCDACRYERCLGLCVGEPGVGKTLAARRYADWDRVSAYVGVFSASGVKLDDVLGSHTVFYPAPVDKAPWHVCNDLQQWRTMLKRFSSEALHREQLARIDELYRREEREKKALRSRKDTTYAMFEALERRRCEQTRQLSREYNLKHKALPDPTELIIIDEADRLKLASLKAAADFRNIGIVLLGLPSLRRWLLRFPFLYWRIARFHEFQPLAGAEVRQLLHSDWWPSEHPIPLRGIDEKSIDAIIHITDGNFRVLHRLLQHIGRVLLARGSTRVTRAVVEAAREGLFIGVPRPLPVA